MTSDLKEFPLYEIQFVHTGSVPSKSNFRKGSDGWKKQWKRIKDFQETLGYLAIHAGTRPLYRKMPVEVEATLLHQRLDVDNAGKAILDALEGVCYENDKQVFRWCVTEVHDSYPSLARLELVVRWHSKQPSINSGEVVV